MNIHVFARSLLASIGAITLLTGAAQAQTLGTCVYGTSIFGSNVELSVEGGYPKHYTNNSGFETTDVGFIDGNTIKIANARLKVLALDDRAFKGRWTYQGKSRTTTWRCK